MKHRRTCFKTLDESFIITMIDAPKSCIWQAEYRNTNYMEYRIERISDFANL